MSNHAICAIATPHGTSALGIVRLSGSNIQEIISPYIDKQLQDRRAVLTSFRSGNSIIDGCIIILYEGPRSYTGEDVIEIISHGNNLILNSIVNVLCDAGAMRAEPGEFTQRAYMNNKLSLAEAEAVSDLISASNVQALKAAQNSLNGKFSDDINSIIGEVISTRAEVESVINFPEDDDVPELSISSIKKKLISCRSSLKSLLNNSYEGKKLNHTMSYVFVGKPNSGKSSIINCLLREDASIVANSAGTTRDSIEYELQINNKIVKITDTAGLRFTEDEIEKEGIARSLKSINKADKIFYVVDHTKGLDDEDKKFIKTFEIENYSIIYNKIDIKGQKPKIVDPKPSEIYISAINNIGLELIKNHIDEDFINIDSSENLYLARSRQVKFLEDAHNRVNSCLQLLEDESFDIIAQELAEGHLALSSILGQNPTEELLNEIFSEFCIGK